MPGNVLPAVRKCTKRVLLARILLVVLIIANLSFIWYNSAKVSKESNKVSKSIAQDVAEKVVKNYEELSRPTQKNHINKINIKLRSMGHFAEFIPLGLLFFFLMISLLRADCKRMISYVIMCAAFAVVLSMLSALADEIHQIFVKGRTFQLADILVDTLGATVGCVLALIPSYIFRKNL